MNKYRTTDDLGNDLECRMIDVLIDNIVALCVSKGSDVENLRDTILVQSEEYAREIMDSDEPKGDLEKFLKD